MSRTWITFAMFILVNATALAGSPASQAWVTENFLPKTSAPIEWSSLCLNGSVLTDQRGCAPNCNSGPTSLACSIILRLGQIEKLSGIPAPYVDNGAVIFKLEQTGGGSGASFNVILNEAASNYNYSCVILNSNGTPATLWNVDTSNPFPTSVITMDPSVGDSPIRSGNFVTTVVTSSVRYWYNNTDNHLYMLCLGYQLSQGSNSPQSHAACGGTQPGCVSYSLA